MSAHIHHGPPGSYKSNGVITDEVIPALVAGRTVVTNIRGLDCVELIAEKMQLKKTIDPSLLINVPMNTDGDEKMRRFYQWVPFKSLVVIDEVQRIYPTSMRNLSEYDYEGGRHQADADNRPFSVPNAFDQHRHSGWDIFCTTPNIEKVHKEIRLVCDYGFRHRDISGLLPWYKSTWKEVQHDPSNKGNLPSHALERPQTKHADPRTFEIYRSVAIDEADKVITKNKSIFSDWKLRACIALFLISITYLSVFSYQKFFSDGKDSNTLAPKTSIQTPATVIKDSDISSANDGTSPSIQDTDVQSLYLNYLDSVLDTVHFLGDMPTGSYFSVNGRVVQSSYLQRYGVQMQRLDEWTYVFKYSGRYRLITRQKKESPEGYAEQFLNDMENQNTRA